MNWMKNALKKQVRKVDKQAAFDLILEDNPNRDKKDALVQYLKTGHYEINGKPVQSILEIREYFSPAIEEFDRRLNELIRRAWSD